jgi:hypothetical protein
LVIIEIVKEGAGWAPVNHMAHLASQMFDTPAIRVNRNGAGLSKIEFAIRGRTRDLEKPDLLLIAPSPRDIYMLAEVDGWRSSFNRAAAWIVDSFWLERSPSRGAAAKFDKLFVMTGNDAVGYEEKLRIPTSFLPWGTDALGLGGRDEVRSIDLLRMGRQPEGLDDDDLNAAESKRLNINYFGRPPFSAGTLELHRSNMAFYRQSRFVLANSNLVAPKPYTHPTSEYITGRWTDALAAGCVVAGVPPYTDMTLQQQFWPGALLELGSVDRTETFAAVRDALDSWTPEMAANNQRMALARLDWRWRFKEIADYFGHHFPVLDRDLAIIRQQVGTEAQLAKA